MDVFTFPELTSASLFLYRSSIKLFFVIDGEATKSGALVIFQALPMFTRKAG